MARMKEYLSTLRLVYEMVASVSNEKIHAILVSEGTERYGGQID